MSDPHWLPGHQKYNSQYTTAAFIIASLEHPGMYFVGLPVGSGRVLQSNGKLTETGAQESDYFHTIEEADAAIIVAVLKGVI